MARLARLLALVLMLAGLAACDRQPDADAAKAALEERLAVALKPPVTEIASFRRMGSSDLQPDAEGRQRRIVYFNATLRLTQDVDFASWNGLSAPAFAALLGASEQGVLGIRQGGNKAGDELHVHGSATFVAADGSWQPVAWVAPAVGVASPGDNSDPPSEARRLLGEVEALLARGEAPRPVRKAVVAEELAKALAAMRLRLDRLDRELVIAGGQEGGEYAGVAALLASAVSRRGLEAAAVASGGSRDNVGLLLRGEADVALVQSDVAADSAGELRALASLFPEPVQVVVGAASPIATIAELKGKRVALGPAGSGTRGNAESALAASGVAIADLAEVREDGLTDGLKALTAGEVDAVFTTLAAPAHALQLAMAAGDVRLLALDSAARERLAGPGTHLVPMTLAANTYPGQAEPIDTVAATALLVATPALPDSAVETVMGEVFGGIDFVQAGSVAGSRIARETAQTGLTVPLHPAAERFLLREPAAP
ncbi:MAG: TAXI family TRAP transporter solute-binding subunit [Geminicoccaceae bacterium]